MCTLENNLEIIGSDDQILEVREYISADGLHIDFNKILKIPEELVDYSCDSLGGFVHSLLFGDTIGFDYEQDDDYGIEDDYSGNGKFDYQKFLQNKFKKLSESQKREGLEKALQYQSNLEKFGGLDNYHWRMKNWGTPFNAGDQWLFAYNKIGFLTEEYSSRKLIIKLSKIFPQPIFNLVVIDPLEQVNSLNKSVYDTDFYFIRNGQYEHYRMNQTGEKIFIYSSYYQRVDHLITSYRENKLKSAC